MELDPWVAVHPPTVASDVDSGQDRHSGTSQFTRSGCTSSALGDSRSPRWENQDVPTKGKRGEDALIELFLRIYGARSWAGELSRREYPERVKDGGVEIIATQVATGRTLAVEHTVIEPFVGEKKDFHENFQELQRQLRADDSLKESGVALYIDAPVNVLPKGTSWQPIIDDVAAFLRTEKSTFGTSKEIRDCPSPHHPKKTIPLQVRRQPLERTAEGFVIVQRYGELRVVESVRKALDKKLAKLAATEADIRILMLERDQAWIDSDEILEHVEALRPQFPMLATVTEIWIVDTATFGTPREWVEFSRQEGGTHAESFAFYRDELHSVARHGMPVPLP